MAEGPFLLQQPREALTQRPRLLLRWGVEHLGSTVPLSPTVQTGDRLSQLDALFLEFLAFFQGRGCADAWAG